jgi:hypothetical protein
MELFTASSRCRFHLEKVVATPSPGSCFLPRISDTAGAVKVLVKSPPRTEGISATLRRFWWSRLKPRNPSSGDEYCRCWTCLVEGGVNNPISESRWCKVFGLAWLQVSGHQVEVQARKQILSASQAAPLPMTDHAYAAVICQIVSGSGQLELSGS